MVIDLMSLFIGMAAGVALVLVWQTFQRMTQKLMSPGCLFLGVLLMLVVLVLWALGFISFAAFGV